MSLFLGMIAAVLLGCAGPAVSPAVPAAPPPAQEPTVPAAPADAVAAAVPLVATAKVEGARLRVDYTLTNNTSGPVHVCAELVIAKGGARGVGHRLIVAPGEGSGTAALMCGRISPNESLMALPTPAFARLEAGASRADYAEVPWPLQSWHPNGTLDPLSGPVRAVVLSVQFFEGEALKWTEIPTTDGQTLRIPEYNNQHWTKSGAMTVP